MIQKDVFENCFNLKQFALINTLSVCLRKWPPISGSGAQIGNGNVCSLIQNVRAKKSGKKPAECPQNRRKLENHLPTSMKSELRCVKRSQTISNAYRLISLDANHCKTHSVPQSARDIAECKGVEVGRSWAKNTLA